MTRYLKSYLKLIGYLAYDMIFSFEYGYTWFHIAKVASRSILEALETAAPPERNGYRIMYKSAKHQRQYKFTFIRNPWDRMVSCYFSKISTRREKFKEFHGMEFPEFVLAVSKKPIYKMTCGPHYRAQYVNIPLKDIDFVGKFELLHRDFDTVCQALNIEVNLPHKNKTDRYNYPEYYDNKTKQIVTKLYSKDVELGSYTFGAT